MENTDYWKNVSASKSTTKSSSSSSSSSGSSSKAKASEGEEAELTYEQVRSALQKNGNYAKANLLSERGYNLLRDRDEKLGTVSVASQSSTYQRYLREMMIQYG